MIPTIEDILRKLRDGAIGYGQALAWINEHLKLAAESVTPSSDERILDRAPINIPEEHRQIIRNAAIEECAVHLEMEYFPQSAAKVRALKNPEQRRSAPVADMPAPSIRDGEAGVAPGRGPAVPDSSDERNRVIEECAAVADWVAEHDWQDVSADINLGIQHGGLRCGKNIRALKNAAPPSPDESIGKSAVVGHTPAVAAPRPEVSVDEMREAIEQSGVGEQFRAKVREGFKAAREAHPEGDPFNCPKCGSHDFGLHRPTCPHCGHSEARPEGALDLSPEALLKDAQDDVLRLHGEKMKFFERTIELERELAEVKERHKRLMREADERYAALLQDMADLRHDMERGMANHNAELAECKAHAEYEANRAEGAIREMVEMDKGRALSATVQGLPAFMRKRIEQAIDEALHPKGMSTHSGMARVHAADIQRLLALLDAAAPSAIRTTDQ